MAWTGIARRTDSRKGLRYSSDMTDKEWQLAPASIPPAERGGAGGGGPRIFAKS